jgi:hypothetical protein
MNTVPTQTPVPGDTVRLTWPGGTTLTGILDSEGLVGGRFLLEGFSEVSVEILRPAVVDTPGVVVAIGSETFVGIGSGLFVDISYPGSEPESWESLTSSRVVSARITHVPTPVTTP